MEKKSLVALDTDHIKQYVFATDKLKEIRGASSVLDFLNRTSMTDIAEPKNTGLPFTAEKVYANGGSGLFLINGGEEEATMFGQAVQRIYNNETVGGASITFAVQEIPDDVQDVWHDPNIWPSLELLRYKLTAEKNIAADIIALPSHPYLTYCEACGKEYAERKDHRQDLDDDNLEGYYCNICWMKHLEDSKVKNRIDAIVDVRNQKHKQIQNESKLPTSAYAWEQTLNRLPESYQIPEGTDRPSDFNKFRGLSGSKDYLALIYADGNGMGQAMSDLKTLDEVHKTAKFIDEAVFEALSDAINKHLQIIPASNHEPPMFQFDILLVGGDDIIIVTPASQALDVACTIGQKFHEYTKEQDPKKEGYSLSIGVVLAPVKYPFGLLQDLAESTLKYAKKEGAKRKNKNKNKDKGVSKFGDTFINFMTVTGSTSLDFSKVYKTLHKKGNTSFYATLRPYTIEELRKMLGTIRDGRKEALGRTKLHQVREAVLKMNLTTSVGEGMAILRNWRTRQRDFVMQHVYKVGNYYQEQHRDPAKPDTLFPRVTFPWFADGPNTYRTPLLDFVELYDFVAQEGGDDDTKD